MHGWMAVGLYVHVDVILFRFLLHPFFDGLCSQCPGAAENARPSAQEHIDADRAGLRALRYGIGTVVRFAGVEFCREALCGFLCGSTGWHCPGAGFSAVPALFT